MNPVYAITSNTEISYGETFSFLRYKIYILENNSCSKIYHVKKTFFFGRSIQNCVYFTVTWARNRIAIFFPLNKNVFYTTSGNLRKGSEIWYRLMIEVKVHGIVNTTKSKFFKEYLLFYLLLKSVIFLKSDGQQFHH